MSLLKQANYYYITDESLDITTKEQVETAVRQGVKIIQYRNKNAPGRILYEEASRISDICKDRALFIVNDRIDVALAVEADGVHLGQSDLPYEKGRELIGDMILGVSTHSLEQALEAEDVADYIGVGPVHATETKKASWEELGIKGALEIAENVDIPTAAIGGIDVNDLEPLSESIDMVCAISSVTQVENLGVMIRRFETKFGRYKGERR